MIIQKKYFISVLLTILLISLTATANAALFMKTEIKSGIIKSIDNNVVELNDGSEFYPYKNGLNLSFNKGETVTIRFYKDTEDLKKYIEIKAGKNSIKPQNEPLRKNINQKK